MGLLRWHHTGPETKMSISCTSLFSVTLYPPRTDLRTCFITQKKRERETVAHNIAEDMVMRRTCHGWIRRTVGGRDGSEEGLIVCLSDCMALWKNGEALCSENELSSSSFLSILILLLVLVTILTKSGHKSIKFKQQLRVFATIDND